MVSDDPALEGAAACAASSCALVDATGIVALTLNVSGLLRPSDR